jgi:hypothetical protein
MDCRGDSCCTPGTIRSTTSGVTTVIGQCLPATSESYKLTGTTAVDRTVDLQQAPDPLCRWFKEVASDHVLKRATKHTLNTLRYRLTKSSATNWHMEVQAENAGATQIVKVFDGNATVASGNCLSSATANNAQTTCDLTASPKRGGHSGTFAKPSASLPALSATCGNCTAVTQNPPSSWSCTIADVVTCVNQCDGDRWRLTGSTNINRTITLNQVGSTCVWEATVSADYVLYDHDTAAESWDIEKIVYDRHRISATQWSWEIYGLDASDVKRVSYAGATSGSCALNAMTHGATSNRCDLVGTANHPSRSFCADQSNHRIIAGSGGSTTSTVCP